MAVQSPADYIRIAQGGGATPILRDEPVVAPPEIHVDDMAVSFGDSGSGAGSFGIGWAGSKYPGGLPAGFGFNHDFEIIDLPTLRRRSRQLFQRNIFAAGLIRRLITNEVNTGLTPQAAIMPSMVGLTEEEAFEWSDNVEERFGLYASDPVQFDHSKEQSMGIVEAELRRLTLLEGDALVVERVSKVGTPSYEIIPGSNIATPMSDKRNIKHGVEIDNNGRHIAYHVVDWEKGTTTRVPASGRRSGRRVAWMVYGGDQRVERVRGVPMLGLVIQSLKEIDIYRDAEQRAAVVNSMIAVYMTRDRDGIGSDALGKGVVRRTEVIQSSDTNEPREFTSAEMLPGMMMTQLAPGEKPESFDTKRPNVNYGAFETAVLSAIAWSNEIPPEILLMTFSHNYSASKAAVSEFSMYLDRVRKLNASQFNKRVYESWLLGEVLAGRIQAPGMLEGFRNAAQRPTYVAWVHSTWIGAIKPSVDLLKDVRAMTEAVKEGFVDRESASLLLLGRSFRTNVRNLKRQNVDMAAANEPIQALEARTFDEDEKEDTDEK